jgi:hypothetical protein
VSGLPEADAAVLEERALKMRKAMGENLADDVAGESVDSKQRRLNMIRCLPLDQSLCPPACPCSLSVRALYVAGLCIGSDDPASDQV